MPNYSDYTKSRTNFLELLPEVYQSGVNTSLLEMTLNRFLTKSELRRVIGFIGQGNPNAIVDRQIQEPTPHRQAYQLQPIMYSQIGTIEHMASWKDIQNELERLGVDLTRMKEWGRSLSFNWAPPIDYDKITNYRDYYWENLDNVGDTPQYVTIQDPCARAEAKVAEYENTIEQFGATHPIVGLNASATTISISGDLTTLFVEGFIFYITNSTNTTINNEFYTTVSSSYQPVGNRTNIVVSLDGSPEPFNDSIVNGDVSLEQLTQVFESEKDCACSGALGWDGSQWDDNQIGEVVWNAELLADISHATEGDWITANGTPEPIEECGSGSPACNSLWYDTTTDELKQYSNAGSPSDWIVVQSNFSEIIANTTGGELWDQSDACEVVTNPWIEQNKWVHKNQVTNFTIAKQAQIPIIEFLPTLELNEWAQTNYEWKYRAEPLTQTFSSTTAEPHSFELTGAELDFVEVSGSPSSTEMVLLSQYGDLTSVFVPGYQFELSGNTTATNNKTYTVVWSIFCEEENDEKWQTRVAVEELFDLTPAVGSPLAPAYNGTLLPILTSLGDEFEGLHEHWVFVGVRESQPVNHQPINPMTPISVNPPPTSNDFVAGSPANTYGTYFLSLYAQEITITTDCFGELDIVGVVDSSSSPSYWVLNGNHEDVIKDLDAIGRKLIVSGNTGGGVNGEYTIVDAVDSGADTIVTVLEVIPSTATVSGTAYFEWKLDFDSSLHNQTRFDSNELRIYVDDVRQYGTYQEINSGVSSPTTTCDDFVNSVVMQTPVELYGTIRIEVGAASTRDIGYESIPVRLDENDDTFSASSDLECVSLVRFRKLEQVKTETNQYPLFDLYDVEGQTVNIASKVFGFQESQDQPIDPYFGRRIVHSSDRREYTYEQFLIDEDNGPLYAYRDTTASGAFWFDTDNQVLYRWTGITWDSKILTTDYIEQGSPETLTCYVTPIVSDDEPGQPWVDVEGMIWFNTNNNSIYVATGATGSPTSTWVQDTTLTAGVILARTDPTLTTIWRTGPNDVVCEQRETYIPEYVDEDRNPVPVTTGSPPVLNTDGDWEIPDQLYFNHLHENRKVLTSSELLAHFTSIISEQEVPPGFFGDATSLFHSLTDINFGKGGTIKEFNESYDTFLSSIFTQSVNPLQLYEFAHDVYENALNQIKETFRADVESFMTDTTEAAVANLSADVADDVIETYEQNDFANLVFGDSNTYIQSTDTGVRNWPATLPFIRMAFKVRPQLLSDTTLGLNEIRHHDGHLSHIEFAATNVNAFNLRIINTTDTRVTNPSGKMGIQSNMAPPSAYVDYFNVFGDTSACYWLYVTPTERTLYRMTAVRVSSETSPPSVALPEGTYWYDETNNRLKVLESGVWVNATTAAGVLTEGAVSAWEVIDLDVILAETILELETRLYNAAPDLDELAFDLEGTFSAYPSLSSEYFEDAFFEFLAQTQITSPFDVSTDYDADDPFTWNYKQSTPSIGGTWQDVYTKTYGTPYPHLEPWKLQGYNEKPTWWDNGDTSSSPTVPYKDPTGTRKWTTEMWSNILDGIVPAGELLPNGDVSTGASLEVQDYAFVSVNIDSVTHDDYAPDDLFPPFWDSTYTAGAPIDFSAAQVRSIYDSMGDILNPDDDYEYDDAGLVEWDWENSSQWLYDQLKVAFRLQPVEFIHDTLGEIFLNIGCLQVSQRLQKVYAHQDAIFHGDLLPDNTVQKYEGTLQWYVNFNRFNGYDASSSNFRPMWVNWTAPLGYQFGTFVDTESLIVFNRNFTTTEQDYRVRIKRSPGIDDHWVDALSATLLKAPPSLIRFDTESQWQYELNSFSPIGRSLTYYGTQSYQFDVVTSGSPESKTLVVNDVHGRTLPWNDGDAVIVTTTEYLPSPLLPDTQYYVNIISSTEFSLSEQQNGPAIEILSDGTGVQTVANVARSFRALSGATTDKIWYAYELDKNLILSMRVPTGIIGIQNLINIIFGYAAWTEDNENFRFNHEATDIDVDTGRVINWQLEVEKLIDSSFQSRNDLGRRHDSYEFEVVNSPLVFNFTTQTETNAAGDVVEKIVAPSWGTGTQVTVSSTGTLPDPLLRNIFYYIIRDSASEFRLAITAKNARNGVAIPITSTGTGTLLIQDVLSRETSPTFEVNPFKNNLWITTPQGIVSDTVKGPFFDVRTDQLLYDQFMDRLPQNHVLPLRQDKLSRILVHDNISTPLSRTEFAHLSSAHIFIDGYEHVLLFENYAAGGELIYDPFIGLNTPKFDTQYDRSPEFTLRPNVGGYVLLNQQDVDLTSKLVRNVEGQVEDLRFAYDTYKVIESNDIVEESRASIGYDGPFEFLSAININPKSQFIFWRGMIQSKGSVNSVNAFINSRRFVDAKIDEFWAVKVADFGDDNELSLPEINIFTSDTRTGEIRFDFVDEVGTADKGFIEVNTQDQDRWYEFPNQQNFFDTVGNMYFNVGVDYVDVTASDYVKLTGSPGTYYIELPYPADDVVVSDSSVTYTQINSQTIEFTGLGSPLPNLRIYLIVPYESKHNPCKIRDVLEEVTVADAILWDPARNNHYHNAINLVDIQRDDDAATYEYQVNSTTGEVEEVFADSYDPWGAKEVGTTWLDTNELGFVPYTDGFVNPSVLDRLRYWGRLAEWASYRMYQWTESDVPPDEYNALSEEQEGDFSIDERIRVTGTVRTENWKLSDGSPQVWEYHPFEKYVYPSYVFIDLPTFVFNEYQNDDTTIYDVYKNGEEALDSSGNPLVLEVSSVISSAVDYEVVDTNETFQYFFVAGDQTSNFSLGDTVEWRDGPADATFTIAGTGVVPIGSPITQTRIEVTPGLETTEVGGVLRNLTTFEGSPVNDVIPNLPDASTFLDGFSKQDFVTFVKRVPDDVVQLTPYSTEQVLVNGIPTTKYYFWVENKSVVETDRNKNVSMLQAVQELEAIPVPYVVPQGLESPVTTTGSPEGSPVKTEEVLPRRYTQAILRNYGTLINADNRYVLRFSRNFILRDDLFDNELISPTDLKTIHQEWLLFRKEQPFNVARALWDLMIESVIGQTIASLGGTAVRVPSLSRELYDSENNTSTRIGIAQTGQALCEGENAWEAILQYLQDGDNDFTPVDIQTFFETYDILNLTPRDPDDAQAIYDMLDELYNTFTFENVNRIWFSVFNTAALPFQVKYEDIFKTSWIALHGIRILETNGIFDD